MTRWLLVLLLCGPSWAWAAGFDNDADCTLDDDLIAYWQLEEASGTRLDELNGCGGTGCDLTDNNTVTQAAGRIGNAADFVAANSEYLSRADHADLSTGDIDFSVATWFFVDLDATSFLVSKRNDGATADEYYLEYLAGGQLAFCIENSAGGSTCMQFNEGLATGTWYFVVGWHDAAANTVNFQLNNGSVRSTAETVTIADSTAAVRLGAANSPPSTFLDGRLDEVGFWKAVLTTAQRTDLYNGGSGSQYDSATTCVPRGGMQFIISKGWQGLFEAPTCSTPTYSNGEVGFHPQGSGPGSIRRALQQIKHFEAEGRCRA